MRMRGWGVVRVGCFLSVGALAIMGAGGCGASLKGDFVGAGKACKGRRLPPENTLPEPRVLQAVAYGSEHVDDLRALYTEARAIIDSPEFVDAMATRQMAVDTESGHVASGDAVVADLRGRTMRWLVSTTVSAQPRCPGRGAGNTELRVAVLSSGEVKGKALVCLSEGPVGWWRSGRVAAKACAINGMVHELTHTVVLQSGHAAYSDDQHSLPGPALVSYTTGSVAQCVYLQRQFEDLDLENCIIEAGERTMRAFTCRDAWLHERTNCAIPEPRGG
jgi:hypothetical protein